MRVTCKTCGDSEVCKKETLEHTIVAAVRRLKDKCSHPTNKGTACKIRTDHEK